MKLSQKWFPIILGLTLLTSAYRINTALAASDQPFQDIAGSYAQNEILDLYHKNVINGTTDQTFDPTKPITRAEFITILDRALNIQPVSSAIPAFIDVPPDSWYYGAVQAGVELGIIEGASLNQFEPTKLITREEAAALLTRALKQKVLDSNSVNLPFSDSALVSGWAVPYVDTVNSLELMVGDSGAFRPSQPITRQETAVVIDKLFTDTRWISGLNASATASPIQLGWQYNETTAEYEQKVMQSAVNTLSPRWYFLGKDLGIMDETDPSLVSWAKQNNKKIWAMVGNGSNQDLTHQLLSQPDKAAAAVTQLSAYIQKYELDGLNIDFENIAPADRDLFTSFIQNLAKELHSYSKTLTIDVSPDTGTDWTQAFDYAALGKSADYIVLMAYDEHWDGDVNAGSVSSLPWFTSGIAKLESQEPANQVIVALPLYTQDWTIQNGNATNQELSLWEQNSVVASNGLLPVWDPTIGQYTTNYMQNNQAHAIWLEDSRSLVLKYQTAMSTGAAGIAYWYIGGESSDIWPSLRNIMKYSSYSFNPG